MQEGTRGEALARLSSGVGVKDRVAKHDEQREGRLDRLEGRDVPRAYRRTTQANRQGSEGSGRLCERWMQVSVTSQRMSSLTHDLQAVPVVAGPDLDRDLRGPPVVAGGHQCEDASLML